MCFHLLIIVLNIISNVISPCVDQRSYSQRHINIPADNKMINSQAASFTIKKIELVRNLSETNFSER